MTADDHADRRPSAASARGARDPDQAAARRRRRWHRVAIPFLVLAGGLGGHRRQPRARASPTSATRARYPRSAPGRTARAGSPNGSPPRASPSSGSPRPETAIRAATVDEATIFVPDAGLPAPVVHPGDHRPAGQPPGRADAGRAGARCCSRRCRSTRPAAAGRPRPCARPAATRSPAGPAPAAVHRTPVRGLRRRSGDATATAAHWWRCRRATARSWSSAPPSRSATTASTRSATPPWPPACSRAAAG